MQPCPTYNDINTRDWYAGEDLAGESMERHSKIYKLEDTGYDPMVHYDAGEEINEKMTQALIKSMEWNDKIPTGVFYVNGISTPYNERILDDIPNYIENPPARQEISTWASRMWTLRPCWTLWMHRAGPPLDACRAKEKTDPWIKQRRSVNVIRQAV